MRILIKIAAILVFCFYGLKSNAAITDYLQNAMLTDTLPAQSLDSVVFERTAVPPTVSKDEWDAHLKKTLKVVYNGVRKKMAAGSYTIQVRFLVERDGSISDAVALSNPGFRLAECAVIIIKTGPKWKPGEFNGKKVRSYHYQPITFEIPH